MPPPLLQAEPQSDAELIRSYLEDRNLEYLGMFFNRHQQSLHHVALRILGNDSDADEVTQVCFEQLLHTRIDTLSKIDNPRAWLQGLCSNCAKKFIRKETQLRQRHQRAQETDSFHKDEDSVQEISDADQELFNNISQCLSSLPQKDQEVIQLYYLECLSWKEVGERLQQKEDTVRKRAQRGLNKLRKLLHKRGVSVSALLLFSAMGKLRGSEFPLANIGNVSVAAHVGFWSSLSFKIASKVSLAAVTVTAVLLLDDEHAHSVVHTEDSTPTVVANAEEKVATTSESTAWRYIKANEIRPHTNLRIETDPQGRHEFILTSTKTGINNRCLLETIFPIDMEQGYNISFTFEIEEVHSPQAWYGFSGNYGMRMPVFGQQGVQFKFSNEITNGTKYQDPKTNSYDINIDIDPKPRRISNKIRKRMPDGMVYTQQSNLMGPEKCSWALGYVSGLTMRISALKIKPLHGIED